MLTAEVEVSQKFVISVVYLPPNPSLLLIQSLSSHRFQFQGSCNIVLLGDFNLPDITVLLIYNFTLTCVYTHGTTQYFASKNPWFAVEKVFSTRQVVASRVAFHDTSLDIPRHVSFPQDVDFHVTSHGIYTQRA